MVAPADGAVAAAGGPCGATGGVPGGVGAGAAPWPAREGGCTHSPFEQTRSPLHCASFSQAKAGAAIVESAAIRTAKTTAGIFLIQLSSSGVEPLRRDPV